jgi:hypothetical protein
MAKILIRSYPPPDDHCFPSPCKGKFLQLLWRGQEYLIFAPFQRHRYHNQILGQFVEEEGIAHRWTSAGMLEMDDRDLLVLGGGRFGLDLARQTLELWGDSQVYGRFNHSRLLEKIASADHPWSGFKLSIF